MRLTRLAFSPYETEADRAAEAEALGAWVDVVPTGSDAEIIVAPSNVRVGVERLESMPSVRCILTTTSGFDHVDLAAARARGIRVGRLPMARRDAVVEVSLSLALAGLHRLEALRAAAAGGRWARSDLAGLGGANLAGVQVGVIGLGVIGRRFAEVCRFLGAQVHGSDPQGLPDGVLASSPAQMVRECELISIHASLGESSRGLIGSDLLAQARGLVLLNTARGDLVDVAAAIEALREGRLSFLGLDVFPQEPWPGMALVNEVPGLVLLPHAAGYHRDLARLVREGLVESVAAFVSGRSMPWELSV